MLEAEDAIPMMLPLTAKEKELDYFLEMCGGFLMTGGQDVSPSVYHAKKEAWCGSCCELRDEMEQYILKGAVDRDKFVLGICRGIQFIVGIQWHPEFSYETDENSRKIINAFVDSI